MLAASVGAVIVSVANFYVQHVAETPRLLAQVNSFYFSPRPLIAPALCSVDLALFDPANRDTALLDVNLWLENFVEPPLGHEASGIFFATESADDELGAKVVGDGEIVLQHFSFAGCDPERLFAALPETNVLRLQLTALDHAGNGHSTSAAIGEAPIFTETAVPVNLFLAATLDLLRNNARYRELNGSAETAALTLTRNEAGELDAQLSRNIQTPFIK